MPYPPSLCELSIRTIAQHLERALKRKEEDGPSSPILLPDELNIMILQHLRNQGLLSSFSLSSFLVTRIHAINLTGCVQVDDACARTISSVCPHIQSMVLSKCPMLSDAGVRSIIDTCLSLKVLHLSKCFQVSDFAFYDLFVCSVFEEAVTLSEEGPSQKNSEASEDKRLVQLLELDLSGTKITDEAISHITARCKDIKVLDVSDCSITVASIIDMSERLKDLSTLRASGCHLEYGAKLALLTRLEGLIARQCPLIGDSALVDVIDKCPHLNTLDLQWSGMTDVTAKALEKIAGNLVSLRLAWCGLVGEEVLTQLLINCTNLQALDLSWRSLHDPAFLQITKNCTKLRILDISGCNELTEKGLSTCGGPDLEILGMSWCKGLTDDALKSILQKSENLKSIDISLCNKLTPISISEIGNHTRLQSLLASKCHQLNDAPLIMTVKNLHDITIVNLSECSITDVAVQELAMSCNKLRVVVLAGCRALTSKSLVALARYCPSVEILNVSNCNIDDNGVERLVQSCGGIASLTLNSCKGITDRALQHISTYTRVLQHLYISFCPLITEDGLSHIGQKCKYLQGIELANNAVKDELLCDLIVNNPLLQVLNANGCKNITDRTIDYLWVYARYLTSLDVSRCEQITSTALDGLLKLMPTLNIHH